jgi:hypothetical protein
MSVLSTVSCALLSAITAFTIVTAAGCGTDAKEVDSCRDIEEARCTAAKNCGQLVGSVSQCQDYYRDQCLHGLPVTPASSADVKTCVATIKAAGVCALQGTDTAPSDCSPKSPSDSPTIAKTTCEIVTHPEETQECSFLKPGAADAGTIDSGGSGGASSDANSSAGAGGLSEAGGSSSGAAAE